MIVCTQCNGGKSSIGQEARMDLSGNSETNQTPGPQPSATLCTQCNGVGYY